MRLILIDNHTGYVFGDSADFAGGRAMESGTDAAQALDASIGEHGRSYEEHGPGYRPASNQTAYHVYRADVGGSEAVPVVYDGQDTETIEAIESACRKVAVVLCLDSSDAAA